MPPSLELPRRARFVDFAGRSFTSDELDLLAATTSIVRLDFKNCAVGDGEVRMICGLPKLESLWLEGTRVTDAALPEIAKLPKLNWLILDRTAIHGAGFAAFANHESLRTLYLSETAVCDDAMPLIARIPRLSLLLAKHTAMTKSGLMALAANPILKVNAGDQFPPDVMTEFEVVQRRSTRCASKTVTPSDADAQAARSVLLGFFAAISQWERDVAQSTAPGSGETDWRIERCRAIFAEFCTPKDRKYGRPNALHCSIPPDYETLQLLDVEWPTLRKVLFYTKDRNGFQHRFLVVKQRDRWLVDHKETLLDGWSRAYL